MGSKREARWAFRGWLRNHGASPVAITKPANAKGYRLIRSNDYGFNTIYVRRGLGEDLLPEVAAESVAVDATTGERKRGPEKAKGH